MILGQDELVEMALLVTSVAERLPIFVVTDHPTDQPEHYVARLHLTLPEHVVTTFAIMALNLDELRAVLDEIGLVKTERADGDDPVILEVWI